MSIVLSTPPAQVYSPPKKDLSWMGFLPEFVDDTVTDYSRPTPSIDVFVKETGCPSVSEVNNSENQPVKYAEMYRSQRPRGNQRNWNNQKSQQLGSDFVMIKKACYMDAQTQGRHEHDQEFDAEITTVGAEVDDIMQT
ncbi:hypothetical protein Tco_1263564 [Tanacetum coccineum]